VKGGKAEWKEGKMCGRFTLIANPAEIEREFHVEVPGDLSPRYNIAPSQEVTVIKGGDSSTSSLIWGFEPSWATYSSHLIINARMESIAEKPLFRDSFLHRRCLVLADGFFEWARERSRSGYVEKVPMYVRLESGKPFAFAGVWNGKSCVIITTPANEVVSAIHNRMPAILVGDACDLWLDTRMTPERLMKVLGPCPLPMRAHTVSRIVNDPKNDRPDCILPVSMTGGERWQRCTRLSVAF
jgi:putative SOS response-associated peptidase YedK